MAGAAAPRPQGVPDAFEHRPDRAEFRRPAHRAGIELYRAHIVRHAFEPHAHEAYGIGAIETGVERFRYRGGEHLAPPGSLVLMNPDELHTGRAGSEDGWRYRMIYLEREVVERVSGETGWWFADAVREDRAAAGRLTALLDGLWRAREPLAFDSLLHGLCAQLRPHARVARPATTAAAPRFGAVIDYLHAHLDRRLTLDELAALADLSPFHFLRAFRARHGVTPQQMLMALRLAAAKRRLAAGQAPAAVAAACGLADQAHLTRAFLRRYGVTPGDYRRQLRG
ncbi:AraC family transcriptional regulator [Solimonas variicoloris]|uniref:AraC family transcriptional regulator n=1 Tax=Solimonas variicoloris TaxID=254408 RepID=UPI000361B452|nr:AraC family transcriptional regulator [Solimonas variicoloris]